MSNSSVACPGEAVLFTCSSPGTTVRWQVNPPAESGLMSVQSIIFLGSGVGRRDTFGSGVIMFEAVLVSNDGGTLTSTLINLSEVSVLDGSNVTCTLVGGGGDVMESQQTTVVVAGKYLPNILLRLNLLNCSCSNLSTQPKTVRQSKSNQLVHYQCRVGHSLLYWWCVCQVCPHHLPNTSLRVTSNHGHHLSTDDHLV